MELANKERNKLVVGNALRYEESFLNKNKEIFSNIDIKENINNDFHNVIMRLASVYSIIGEFKKAEKYLSLT